MRPWLIAVAALLPTVSHAVLYPCKVHRSLFRGRGRGRGLVSKSLTLLRSRLASTFFSFCVAWIDPGGWGGVGC
jgi:hypothetical protein